MKLQHMGMLEDYLQESEYMNYSDERIQVLIGSLQAEYPSELARIEAAFEFVRDEIKHTYDVQKRDVTRTASDVMGQGHGICYAKSHLLVALLRGMGIPAGICYQRLTLFDEPEDGYCIHALNTVYIHELNKWIRLDARGNKVGVNAQFSVKEERLAFPIRTDYGEVDYMVNYVEPHPSIIKVLEDNDDCLVMYRNGLPDQIEEGA